MRVLVVLTQPPLPEGGAPGRTALGLLRGLVAHGLDVQALAGRQHFALPGDPPPGLPVEVVPVAPDGGALSELELDDVPELLAPGRAERAVASDEVMDVDERRALESFVAPGGLGLLEVDDVGPGCKLADAREKLRPR